MDDDKSLGGLFNEFRQMALTYVRQEVTAPLKGATQYLKWGLVGGVLGILAAVLIAVGGLRLLQTVTLLDIDRGAWSWLVYLVWAVVCLAVGAVFIILGFRGGKDKGGKDEGR